MGRLKQFDPDEIEQKAMEYFWQNGYQGVSVDALTEVLGISRSSLYSVWQGKDQLFRRAFHRYLHTIGSEAFQPLLSSVSSASGSQQSMGNQESSSKASIAEETQKKIEEVFFIVTKQISQDPYRRGCLMVNTITELSFLEPELGAMAYTAQNEVLHMFQAALQPMVDTNQWTREEAQEKADCLLTLFLGLRVLARTGPSFSQARGIVSQSLKAIF